ncbi:hypothetical protein HDU96_002284 [Phlyctochytrium bullatum]|nr:hypothetical protein HDU96_002284 [Phlyctochytrium bullatum]
MLQMARTVHVYRQSMRALPGTHGLLHNVAAELRTQVDQLASTVRSFQVAGPPAPTAPVASPPTRPAGPPPPPPTRSIDPAWHPVTSRNRPPPADAAPAPTRPAPRTRTDALNVFRTNAAAFAARAGPAPLGPVSNPQDLATVHLTNVVPPAGGDGWFTSDLRRTLRLTGLFAPDEFLDIQPVTRRTIGFTVRSSRVAYVQACLVDDLQLGRLAPPDFDPTKPLRPTASPAKIVAAQVARLRHLVADASKDLALRHFFRNVLRTQYTDPGPDIALPALPEPSDPPARPAGLTVADLLNAEPPAPPTPTPPAPAPRPRPPSPTPRPPTPSPVPTPDSDPVTRKRAAATAAPVDGPEDEGPRLIKRPSRSRLGTVGQFGPLPPVAPSSSSPSSSAPPTAAPAADVPMSDHDPTPAP